MESFPNGYVEIPNFDASNSGYILLLGLTGSGKSSTINRFFNKDIAYTSELRAGTEEISEYDVIFEESGISRKKLTIIDTPGFGDIEERDTKTLATLRKYLRNHEVLSNKAPDLVLIVVKFNDNRSFNGPDTEFVKMLKKINLLQDQLVIKDPHLSNLLFVMTHFNGVDSGLKQEPQRRYKCIQEFVERITQFPTPIKIKMAENCPDDLEKDENSGFWKLPNGEFYPLNIFKAFSDMMGDQDTPGSNIIKNAFSEPGFLKCPKNENRAIKTPLVSVDSIEYREIYQKVQEINLSTSAEQSDFKESELHKKLLETISYLPPNLKDNFNTALFILSNYFISKDVPIVSISQLPHDKNSTIDFVRDLNSNETVNAILQYILPVKLPVFETSLLVGSGFNVFTGNTCQNSIYQIDECSVSSPIGFKLPPGITCKIDRNSQKTCEFSKSLSEYKLETFQKITGKSQCNIDCINFNVKTKCGYNFVNNLTSNSKHTSISGCEEYRNFILSLDGRKLLYNEDFKDDLANLKNFNSNDMESRNEWNNFFIKYGTHVIKAAFGGGYTEIKYSCKNLEKIISSSSKTQNYANIKADVFAYGENTGNHITISQGSNSNEVDRSSSEDRKWEFAFYGGDSKYNKVGKMIGVREMENWVGSLKGDPIMIVESVSLEPLSLFVQKCGIPRKDELERAYQFFLYEVPPIRSALKRHLLDPVKGIFVDTVTQNPAADPNPSNTLNSFWSRCNIL